MPACKVCAEIIGRYNAAARIHDNLTALRALAEYDTHFSTAHRRGQTFRDFPSR